jgi:hypothetical protein
MKRLPLLLVISGILTLGLVFQATAGSKGTQVLKFNTMTPVVSPFTGSTNPVRGINGGGVPWRQPRDQGQGAGRRRKRREPRRCLPRGGQLSDAGLADHGRHPGERSCSCDERGRREDQGRPCAADTVPRTDRLRDERDRASTRRLVRDYRGRLGRRRTRGEDGASRRPPALRRERPFAPQRPLAPSIVACGRKLRTCRRERGCSGRGASRSSRLRSTRPRPATCPRASG